YVKKSDDLSALPIFCNSGKCQFPNGAERLRLVELLLNSGAKIDSKDCDGLTALHYAVRESDYDLVRLFLNHGAHIDQMLVFGKGQPMERLYQQLREKEDCPIEEMTYVSLQCLAARTIVDNNIDYK